MVQISFNVRGTKEAETALEALERGAGSVGRMHVYVGSTDPRARWFEKGFHPRGGKTMVPGRHMLEKAAASHTAGLAEAIATALDKGDDALGMAVARGRAIAQAAAAAAPEGSGATGLKGRGRLRDSYTVRVGKR